MRAIDGRYEVIRKLGEGGMGRVWLVRDREDKGRELALKFISQQVMEREGAQGFKHEFELLTRLRHPNLAEVYDFGHSQDGCFFTMEYVPGEDLFAYARRNPPQKLLGVVVGVLRALEYIHSRGLIHYDVKPENIRVRDKVVKLMDLGLTGEGGIRLEGRIKGTLAYIAPELARGIEVDKRADLYSLGVTLYYVLMGKLPFDGQTPLEVIRSQVGKESLPLSTDFPPPWKEIVPKLLSLEPYDRYSSANEVIRAINILSGEKFPTETKETGASYILSGKFVGRDRELKRLGEIMESRFSGAGGDKPTLVLLQGEGGIGKKRLLRELKYKAQLDGVGFFCGKCYQEGGDPYQPWVEILRGVVGTLDKEDSSLKRYSSELVKLLPSLIEAKPSPELEPDQEKLRLHDAITSFLCQVSSSNPLLLALIDIQWSDEINLELLSYLGRNNKEERILICANLQDEEEIPASLREIENEDYCQNLPLERLGKSEMRELIGSMLGVTHVPHEVEEKIIQRAGGNPLLIEETMKSLTEEGILYRQDGKWKCDSGGLADFEIPASVNGVMEKRLARLTSGEFQLLQALAVINHPVELKILPVVLPLAPKELTQPMNNLERKRLVRRSWQSGTAMGEISHQTTSNLVYSRIPPRERRVLHQRVGLALEKRGVGVEELAYHFQRGHGGAKAVTYCWKAGLRAKELYSNQLSTSYFQWALQNLGKGKPKLKARILGELGEVLGYTGEPEKAIAVYEQVLRDYGSALNNRQRAKIYSRLSRAWERKSEYERALQVLKEGMEHLGSGAKGRLPAELLADMAMVELRKGDFDSCLRLGQKGLEVLGSRKACQESGLLYNVLGNAYFYRGEPKKAEEFYQKSLRIREKLGNQRAISSSLNNLGNIHFVQGEHSKAVDYHTRSMEMSERIGNIMGISGSYINLGNIYQVGGQPSKALSYFQKSLEINQRVGDTNGQASCMNNIAGIHIDKGNYREAADLFQSSQEIFRQIGNRFGDAMCYTNLGITYFARGKYSRALSLYSQGLKMSKLVGNSQLEAVTLTNFAEACLTLGRVEEARKVIEKVISLLERTGEKLLLAEAYSLLGRVELAKGKPQQAEDNLRKALEFSTKLGDERIRGSTFVELGYISLEQGKYEEALGYCEEALSTAERHGEKELLARAHLLRGEVEGLRSWGNRSRALKFLEKGVNLARGMEIPELQWKGNYQIGKLYQEGKFLQRALRHYAECVSIFKSSCYRIKGERLKWSYLEDKGRKEVFEEIKKLKEIAP